MGEYTKANLRDEVENQSPKHGMPDELEARFARSAIGGETLGLTLFTLAPGFRMPFGHKHKDQEEVYVIVRGSARIKVDGEVVGPASGTRSASTTTRCGTSRQALTGSSTWRSAPATTRGTRTWFPAGGSTSAAGRTLEGP